MGERPISLASSIVERSRRRWHFGRAVLNECTHELVVNGIDVELERKPLEVLIYLLLHAGEVCTKDELLAGVWPGRVLSETVLTKSIGRLRDVLGDENQEIIKTAYGFGYRFVAPVRVEAAPTAEPTRFDFRPGDHPPSRPLWSLVERLGIGGYGEAWRGRHEKTHEQRVFKFALDEPSLGALKREITLFRVINDTLGESARVVKLLDWNLEQAPYFLEIEYFPDGSLLDWVRSRGGIVTIPMSQRLEIVAKVAESLAAVHSVGVLHKDLKPSNILVKLGDANCIDIALSDFGSGGVIDSHYLDDLGISRAGFTRTIAGAALDSGTPLYLAPEILAGQPPTVKADIYALGVILYQMVVGDFHRAMSPGWERNVGDTLLLEDISLVADGNPAERLGDAAEFARRIRCLDERRKQRERELQAQVKAEEIRLALERSRAGRPARLVAVGVLLLAFGVSSYLYFSARDAQRHAQQAAAITKEVSHFLTKDVFGSIDLTKRPVRDLTIKEVLDSGAAQIDTRFKNAPDVAAELHAALGASYGALEMPELYRELDRALDLYENRNGLGSRESLQILTQLLSFQHPPARFAPLVDHATRALAKGKERYGESDDTVLGLRFQLAQAQYHQGDWADAVIELRLLAGDLDRFIPGESHFGAELEQQLGEALLNVAEFRESESWLQKAHKASDRSSASSGLRTSMIHMDLGNLYRETQRFEDADRELATALSEVLRWVPNSSLYAIRVRRAMGQLRLEQGRPQEARAILEDLLHVLASFPSDVDRDHSALIRYSLGLAYLALANLPGAADALTGALTRNEVVEGLHAPRTELIRIALGDALTQQGHIAEAEALLRSVATAGLPGLPKDHPFLGELRRAQGLLLAKQGRTDDAKIALQDASRIFAARYGDGHWRLRRAQDELTKLERSTTS
jgi:serine/threonine protein kinase/DNA-binding winged helix-turn-helix (wHTH) protein